MSLRLSTYEFPYIDVPSAPVNIQLIGLGSRVANISWQDGVSSIVGNPPTEFYQVLLLNDSSNVTFNVSTTSVSLNQLLPFSNYTITIFAENSLGSSNNSEPFSFTTNEERKFNKYRQYNMMTIWEMEQA